MKINLFGLMNQSGTDKAEEAASILLETHVFCTEVFKKVSSIEKSMLTAMTAFAMNSAYSSGKQAITVGELMPFLVKIPSPPPYKNLIDTMLKTLREAPQDAAVEGYTEAVAELSEHLGALKRQYDSGAYKKIGKKAKKHRKA